MDTSVSRSEEQKTDKPLDGYTSPIARTGEQQFACILRNRSGISAGEIDFGARFINDLSDREQQAAIESAYSVYLKWCQETGKKSHRDHPGVKSLDTKTVIMPRELTAENGAKKLLSGEFSVGHFIECGHCDNGDSKLEPDGDYEECELCEGQGGFNIDLPIEWNKIKKIYAMAVQHLGK